MPIPSPSKGESKDDFIERCMSSDAMKEEFPDDRQRTGVCFKQWRGEEDVNPPEETTRNESITVNFTLYRMEKVNDTDFMVAPVTAIVEGVHNGSGGAAFYSAEELERSVRAWNGKPLTIQHPLSEDGTPVSASTPFGQTVTVGNFWNVYYDNGKLKGEVWIDIKRCLQIAPQILEIIKQNSRLEVSTGLIADSDKREGIWNGEQYLEALSNIVPDHLALLPGKQGACDWNDGCGVRMNRTEEKMKNNDTEAKLTNDPENNKKAQDDNSKLHREEKINMEKRKEQVEAILANEKLPAFTTKEDFELLINMEQPLFEKVFNTHSELLECACREQAAIALEAKKKVTNEEAKKEEKEVKKPMTAEEYINAAPEEVREVLIQNKQEFDRKKNSIVKVILNDKRNKFSEEALKAKSIDELENIIAFAEIATVQDYSGRKVVNSDSDNVIAYNERHPDGSGVPDAPDYIAVIRNAAVKK